MDTKKLAALAAAVRLGSFTRAAEELGYTQSGLTHMMNSLEKDVGFPVLVRSRSGVRLTPAGQRIFPLVQECLAGAEALEHEILLINTHQEESVRVAAYDSIARHWLPEDSQKQRMMLEGLVNSLCSLEGVEQVQILLNGDYQMLLGTQPVSRPLLPTE